MFNLFRKSAHREISAGALQTMLDEGSAMVIDVREAAEFADGHIPGAINMPLSTFQATKLPDAGGKTLVLNCAAGRRSAMALDKCAQVREDVTTHLQGGMGAWRAAGLRVER